MKHPSLALVLFAVGGVSLNACGSEGSGRGTDGRNNGGSAASGGSGSGTGGSSTGGTSPGSGGTTPGSGGTTPGTGGAGTGGTGGSGAGFACPSSPGTAPTGALSATQIEAANPTDFDFHLLEGPVWIDGALYYSDFKNSPFPSEIKKYTPGVSPAEVFIPNSGSNGLAVNQDGNIVAATHDLKEISLYNLTSKARTPLVEEYESNPFNSPNDLVIGANGDIYFTDPNFQVGGGDGSQPGQVTRVYHWNGSEVSVVDDTFSNPNGIALSPDGSTLYVAGDGQNGSLRSYPVVDGVPGSGTDIADMQEPDGMTVDCLGNIYATEHSNSRVRVFNPSGTEIATISIGMANTMGGTQDSNATNTAFGGAEGKTLYITGTYALWEIDLDVVGLPY